MLEEIKKLIVNNKGKIIYEFEEKSKISKSMILHYLFFENDNKKRFSFSVSNQNNVFCLTDIKMIKYYYLGTNPSILMKKMFECLSER